MEEVLVATHNPSKFKRYKSLLDDISGLLLVSLNDLNISEKVPEINNNPLDNAKDKAIKYAEISGLPTLAIDESATTNFLSPGEQPGVYVRRHSSTGKEMSDNEQLKHWKKVFEKNSQTGKTITWAYAQVLYIPQSQSLFSSEVKTTNRISSHFSNVVIPGYPMSSFQIMEGTDKPHSELSDEERKNTDKRIFKEFVDKFRSWIKSIK